MARVEEPGRDPLRVAGRGREETTPLFVHAGVFVAVAILVLLAIGFVFLAQALA